jgi:putative ABC transport system permease protein
VLDNLICAGRAIAENWLRSALTITGIVIGVVAIVTLIAILQGVKREIAEQVEGLGANLVMVVPGKLDDDGQPNPMALMGISSLSDSDVNALSHVPGVAQISPVAFVSGTIDAGKTPSASALVVATNRVGVEMNPTRLAEGRYFNDNEDHVCILTNKPRLALFGRGPALGKIIRVRDKSWTVVGVLGAPKADSMLGNAVLGINNLVYLPVHTVRHEIPGGQINRIVLRTDYAHPASKLLHTLDATVRRNHGGRDDYGMITQEKGLAMVVKLLDMAQSLLVLIAAISLFVAGVGIMNIMLVTVTERTREIGVRKTVGARRRDIFLQFLTEAVILSIIGGIIGLAVSWTVCFLVGRYSMLKPEITPGAVTVALSVCVVVGAIFGVAPAVRAGRLDPIEALRYD